ncbi:hypothetical protein AMECASPLE_021720 [Ameca splendens]|uniref:Uncharacterized protein n=1 Tax=Ameca splendens TaxID=208324 RepID=A0ABV0Z1M6_9TELE
MNTKMQQIKCRQTATLIRICRENKPLAQSDFSFYNKIDTDVKEQWAVLREAVASAPLCSILTKTITQRASNTLAPSTGAHPYCKDIVGSGSKLGRERCVFCDV